MVFEYLGVISYVITMFVCALSYEIFRLLFTEEYLKGYIVAPYLFLAPLLLMLFQVIANQFLVIKKTWPNMLILIAGALINVGLNYLLIPMIGIEGAAIATLAGYIAALLIASAVLTRMRLLKVSGRFMAATAVMAAVMLIWRICFTDKMLYMLLTAVAGGAVIVLLYIRDIKMLCEKIVGRKA